MKQCTPATTTYSIHCYITTVSCQFLIPAINIANAYVQAQKRAILHAKHMYGKYTT